MSESINTVPVIFSMDELELDETLVLTIGYIMYALTIASFVYGVISWCIIKKFCNYRNYVCLNAILANLLYITLYRHSEYFTLQIHKRETYLKWELAISITTDYCGAVKHHWLLVLCHMFYIDIVKVFNGHVQRRYLKSSIFAWGASLMIIVLHVSLGFVIIHFKLNVSTDDWPIAYVILMLPLILNILLYIVIVYSLFRGSSTSTPTAINKWRRLYIATLIFILGDVALLSTYVAVFIKQGLPRYIFLFARRRVWNDAIIQFLYKWSPSYIIKSLLRHGILYKYLELLNLFINPIVMAVFLVIVKSNRECWYEFYINKLARHHDNNIHMRVIRESADSRSTAAPGGDCYTHANCVTDIESQSESF